MMNKLRAVALSFVAASLVSTAVAYACPYWATCPDPYFTDPQQQVLDDVVNQLAAPGKEAQVHDIAVGFIQAQTMSGRSIDVAIQHLTEAAQ